VIWAYLAGVVTLPALGLVAAVVWAWLRARDEDAVLRAAIQHERRAGRWCP